MLNTTPIQTGQPAAPTRSQTTALRSERTPPTGVYREFVRQTGIALEA